MCVHDIIKLENRINTHFYKSNLPCKKKKNLYLDLNHLQIKEKQKLKCIPIY